MPLPRINHFLSRHCHCKGWNEPGPECLLQRGCYGCNGAAESDMKIYLLIMLIGTILTAVHFTSTPERQPERLPQ
jgi:hypothetical protein